GIQNYLDVPGLMDATQGTSHDEIAKLFFERLQLEFPPGETWSYSNSAYLLLGNIVEKTSGKTYWEFLDERIFKPLGMKATRSSEPRAVVPRRAAGYEWRGDRFENRPPLTDNAYAAGSIVSTVQDMAKWDPGKVLAKQSLDTMWTPNKARGGAIAPFNYGFGWFVDIWHGRRVVSHTGGTPGFSSALYRFADDRLTVIVLTNHTDRVIDHLAVDVVGLYVPALARPKTASADPDPERSRMLRETLLGLFEGRHDPARFTPAMQTFLKTTVGKGIWGWAAADGPMKSFTFGESEKAGDARILRYKTTLGNVTRWFSFTLTGEGRVAQVFWW
ncbi:MAG: serine hydrolase domain-containing protein, partial [Thermoanaerobaculia bacterium]